jgi:large subunit ribosomal protein L10
LFRPRPASGGEAVLFSGRHSRGQRPKHPNRGEVIPISEKVIPYREPKPEKVEQVATLTDLLDRSSAVLLADYRGLTVAEKADLTRRLREADAEFHVVKNTLFRRAYGERGEDPSEWLSGPTAVAFALNDPVTPSKVLLDFIKEKRKGVVKGGVVDGRLFDEKQITQLSQLPPKDQLIAEVLGSIQSPLTNMVFTLQGVLSEFLLTLQAIGDQQGGAAPAAE